MSNKITSLNIEEFRALENISNSQKQNKYKNQKAEYAGITFDSKKERDRYRYLEMLQRSGMIRELQIQVPFTLIDKNKNGSAVKYIADFVYFDIEKKRQIIEDVKGVKTPVYKLKKRLMAEKGYLITEV